MLRSKFGSAAFARAFVGSVLVALAVSACGGGDEGELPPTQNALPPPASALNVPPTIGGTPPSGAQEGVAYSFTPTASDADGDTLSFDIVNKPAWASFSTSSGALSGAPTAADVGESAQIEIFVSDGKAQASLAPFTLSIAAAPAPPPAPAPPGPAPSPTPPPPSPTPPPANVAPSISGSPSTSATVGQAYSFQPTAADANNDALSFSITNKPSWASFSSSSGRLSGTPAAGNVGTTAAIRVSVSDGKLSTSLPSFTIRIAAAANRAPTISGTPSTSVAASAAYSFQPAASDPDGDSLSYSIQNKPTWATFSIANGRLTGTPTTSHVGNYAGIVITVSDGKVSAALPAFSVAVTSAPNKAPTITGTATKTVTAGSAYSFTPTAADGDAGDTLTFAIQNKPEWATFDTQNGRLSGTPTAADVGAHAGIVITVTDGKATTALAAFTITVNQVSTGSASLSWTAPTTNTDGTTLGSFTGYRIAYGTAPGSLTQTVQIANPSVTTYTLENLSSGTWYFALKVYAGSTESALTNVASKTIP
jgi:hypothetical protein